MFGFIGDAIDGVIDTVDNFVSDPIGTTIDVVTQPLRDTIDIIDGLTEGEIRTKAIARLGVDVVSGMAASEIIEWYKSN